ncbi:MAG: HAMP domain-containing histidine kinase [Acidobacteriales bacterium]|nr:HAMP domain-containing histidine kinase [Terriglobales bacterium]
MTGRQKAIGFFITLSVVLITAAVALNISWIVALERRPVLLVLGIITFALIIAGFVVYTIFLVREMRITEQQNSFIHAVTHELKTPIASIKLYLETLQTRELSDAQRKEFYQVMLGDTDRLTYTVEQVLKAGVAGQKTEKPPMQAVDLRALLEECVVLARQRHHLSTEAMSVRESGGLPDTTVLGDLDGLRTAVTNLLDNAVKYSGGHVQVVAELAPAENDRLQVRVRDRGVGIPRNQLKLVFRRFYRAPGRAARQVKGTGLGLYIVRAIAKKHGGRVFAESAGEGQGSTFTLELPKNG